MHTRALLATIVAYLATGTPTSVAVDIIYVDAGVTGGAQDGQTWCSAFSDLREALASIAPGPSYEVRVAEGVYTPAAPDGNRFDSFELRSGVAILGGFAGCGGTNPDQRDPTLFESVLSGDLNGNDNTGGDNSENSFHVVSGSAADATAILDGFTITAAWANGTNPSDRGGGIFLFPLPASPTIRNCIIRDNHVLAKGAGMYAFGAQATVEHCVFRANTSHDGGALYNLQGASTFTDCAFRDNAASSLGGAVFNLSSAPTFHRCLIADNQAIGGGGMQNATSQATIIGCTFRGNLAAGGLQPSGGGLLNQSSEPVIVNCLFDGNTAGQTGGAMHSSLNSAVSIHNGTFVHNQASVGGGVSNGTSSATTIDSSILWANADDSPGETAQIAVFSGALTVGHTCVQDLPAEFVGQGNISLDPAFQLILGQDGQAGTEDDVLQLTADSPCIDAGDPAAADAVPAFDLAGNQRIQCGRIDMGALEFPENENCNMVNVPTVSNWGLIVLALLLLVMAKLPRKHAHRSQ